MSSSKSPYQQRSLADWQRDLESAAAGEDRYRALLAINALATPFEAVSGCRAALTDAEPGVRALAAKRLREWRQLSEGAAPSPDWEGIADDLRRVLADTDPDVQFEAARALGWIWPDGDEGVTVLWRMLGDDEAQPLMLALLVTALAEHPRSCPEAHLPRLRELLRHPQAEIRENTSGLIATSVTAAQVLEAELVVALDDDEPIVRENAAIALGHIPLKGPETCAALTRAAEDEDEGVAAAARRASGQPTAD